MNPSSFEEEIRSLRPGPVPPDLLARMAEPPPVATPRGGWNVLRVAFGSGLAVAAAVAIMAGWPALPVAPMAPASASSPHLSTSQKSSVLLDTRTLAVLHRDGRTWEVAEQRWRDDQLVLCSVVPVQVQAAEIRREIICRMVDFD